MSYQTTDVYQYLAYINNYLHGDLKTFHEVCDRYEQMEREKRETGGTSGVSASSTTTTQTTLNPIATGRNGTSGYGPYNPDNIPEYYRLTIPVALILFSTADVVGYLIGSGSEDDTKGNFNTFFIGLTDLEKKVLVIVFRHGMSHTYFPKLDVGVSYHSTNPTDKLFIKENGSLVLNVNALEGIVLSRFVEIFNDSSRYANMETQYQNMINKYEGKNRDDINNLKGLL